MLEISNKESEFEKTIANHATSGNIELLALAECNYADYLSDVGRKLIAIEHYNRAYEYFVDLALQDKSDLVLWKLALDYEYVGRFSRSLAILHRLSDIAAVHNEFEREALVIAEIGEIQRIVGDVAEAKQLHTRAIGILRDLGLSSSLTRVHHYLAKLYLAEYELEEAAQELTKIDILLANNIRENSTQSEIEITRSRVALASQETTQAIFRLNELVNSDHPTLSVTRAIAMLNLALAYLEQGEFAAAADQTQKALELLKNSDSWRVCEGQQILARCYLALNDSPLANKVAGQAMVGYLDLGMHKRINHVERTMYRASTSVISSLDQDELQYEFGDVGI
jgi:tetratricopeptide (TPR) repeat protein